MEDKDKYSIFGAGFVLGEFAKQYPLESIVIGRDELTAKSDNILYGISTTDNYNPKNGDPHIDVQTNLVHFLKVLDLNINEEVTFNLVSTWFVCANAPLPAKEDAVCDPKGFYSITALARERLLQSYCETFGLKYRIIRLCNIIGIGDEKASPKKNALQWMISELAKGNEVQLYKGDHVRDYMDVRDCAAAIKIVLEKGDLNQIYNVSNGVGRNVGELLDRANCAIGYKGKVTEKDTPDFHKQVQIQKFYMDNSKLKSLGHESQYDVNKTVEELALHYARLHDENKKSNAFEQANQQAN